MFENVISDERSKLSLPSLKDSIPNLILKDHVPIMNNWSPFLLPKPSDWTESMEVTGSIVLNELVNGYQAPSDLMLFLKNCAEPPIYIGLGNMIKRYNKDQFIKLWRMFLHATRHLERQIIISVNGLRLSELLGNEDETLPKKYKLVDYVSHEWLLPQCAVSIIHGGVGTVHSCLRAGSIPIIVEFGGDQVCCFIDFVVPYVVIGIN